MTCFILFAGEAGCPQSLSTLVLPSEDELIEAYKNGEIDYAQFVVILDLIQQGIDSTDSYLFDEIPNLSFRQPDSASIGTELESEQSAAFVENSPGGSSRFGIVKYRFLQSLEQDARASYYLSTRLQVSPNWRARFQVRREYSGRERWTNRSIEYRNNRGFARRFILGTFNARLGMGTVFGYRGKLVSFSDRLDRESFLYPDFGGFNGLYFVGEAGAVQIQSIGSVVRDEGFSVSSAGTALSYRIGSLTPGVVVGVSRVTNRATQESITDAKVAFNSSYGYKHGLSSTEVVAQLGHGSAVWSAVVDGKHRSRGVEVRYSGWSYADRYLNLTGGSKSASIYCRTVVPELEFDCSDRRAGQTGGQIRAALKPRGSWLMVGSLVLAARDHSNRNRELMRSVQYAWSARVSTQVDYLTRHRWRSADSGDDDSSDRRWRLETRIQSGKLTLRSYIAYTWDSENGEYSSVFLMARRAFSTVGSVEFWSNFGRIRSGRLEYWYLFVRLEQQLLDSISMAAKFAHAYHRGGSRSSQPSLSLELEAQL